MDALPEAGSMTDVERLAYRSRLQSIEERAQSILDMIAGRTRDDYANEPGEPIDCGEHVLRDYAHVDDERVWRVVHQELPTLLSQVRSLLAAGEKPA